MTKKEKILEDLEKSLLIEMAIPRSTFTNNIETQGKITLFHLIYCFLQTNNTEYEHWRGEVYGNFSAFDKLKYSKKYPTVEDFLDCGMETWFERIEDQLDYWILKAYNKELDEDIMSIDELSKKLNRNINIDDLGKYLISYFKFVIQNIQPNGKLDKIDAYNEIDKLVKEYNKN